MARSREDRPQDRIVELHSGSVDGYAANERASSHGSSRHEEDHVGTQSGRNTASSLSKNLTVLGRGGGDRETNADQVVCTVIVGPRQGPNPDGFIALALTSRFELSSISEKVWKKMLIH